MNSFEKLINRYIKILQKKGEPNEKYKYDSIDVFQKNWNIDAPDFYKMFLNSLAKRSNLLFQNSWGFIHLLAKHLPEKARLLFKNLYDEKIPLEERFLYFQKESEKLVTDVKKLSYKQTLNHQQDERTIALYLAFRYPEKYILYKNDFYKSYCDEFGLKTEKVGKKFFHLNRIADDIIRSNILNNSEFQNIYRRFYSKPLWNDERLMIQNILFVCYREEKNETDIVDVLNNFDFDDLLNYYEFLDRIIEKFDLQEEDKRLVFNTNEKELIFTIGQRYVWNLRNIKNDNFNYRVISVKQFSPNYEKFEGTQVSFLNNEDSFNTIVLNSEDVFNAIEIELDRTKISGYSKYNNSSIEKLAFDKDYRGYIFSQLNKNKKTKTTEAKKINMENYIFNQILYGPPGTGKTYNTINKALEIINDEEVKQLDFNDRKAVKDLFDKKLEEGQIMFTTFHQSMSYEDFIEGIKPEIEEDEEGRKSVIYEVKKGIFKQIAEEARKVRYQSEETSKQYTFDDAWDDLVSEANEYLEKEESLILNIQTVGMGLKVVDISEKGNLKVQPKSSKEANIYTVSFSRAKKLQEAFPDLSVIKNIDKEFRAVIGGSNSTAYWAVLNFINQKINSESVITQQEIPLAPKPYVLIIDEINRGNVSQIFGELITLIEEDKRLGKNEALEVILPYSKEKFGVPANLYIIGTMNTADRSVEALDTALRRRFSFVEMMPDENIFDTLNISDSDLRKEVMLKINQRIEVLLDRNYVLGHSYFIKENFKNSFENEIIPMLQEYFYNDYGKIGLVLGKGFVREKSITAKNDKSIFADFETKNEVDIIKTYELIPFGEVDFDTAIQTLLA